MNYIEFDCSPVEESCVSVSRTEDYMPAMRTEARRMIGMLQKRFPDLKGEFRIGTAGHDFGSYLEIRFYHTDDDEGHSESNFVESNYPRTWNDDEVMNLYTTV